MNRLLSVAILCIAALSTTAFSQGQYLKAGESGVGLTASMDFAKEETTFGGGPAFSYQGYVDVSAGYAHISVKTKDTPSIEFSGNNYIGQLTVHPLKQSESMPVGLAVNGAYLHSTYGGGDLDKLNIKGSANAFGAGGILHRTTPIGDKMSVLAGAGYAFTHASIDMGGTKSTDNSNSYPIVLEGIFSVGEKGKIVIGPEFTFNKDANVFGVSASYIMVL